MFKRLGPMGMAALALVSGGLAVGLYIWAVLGTFYSGGALPEARRFYRSSEELSLKLGTLGKEMPKPFKSNLMESTDGYGHADMVFDLRGAKGEGRLVVTERMKGGVWSVMSATLNGAPLATEAESAGH